MVAPSKKVFAVNRLRRLVETLNHIMSLYPSSITQPERDCNQNRLRKSQGCPTDHWDFCAAKNPRTVTALGFIGGGGRIRTIEAKRSRFTVCPLWPLGNSPIFCSSGFWLKKRAGSDGAGRTEHAYYSTESRFVKLFRAAFWKKFESGFPAPEQQHFRAFLGKIRILRPFLLRRRRSGGTGPRRLPAGCASSSGGTWCLWPRIRQWSGSDS